MRNVVAVDDVNDTNTAVGAVNEDYNNGGNEAKRKKKGEFSVSYGCNFKV